MIKFFHKLMNPHCEECRLEMECPSCETLRAQLVQANFERSQLLNTVLNMNKPPDANIHFTDDIQPEAIKNKNVPWHVRRQMLEAEDRKRAELIRAKNKEAEEIKKQEEAKKSIDELEKKVGIQSEVIGEIK